MANLEEDAREKFLLKAAKHSFYNTSQMDLSKMGSGGHQIQPAHLTSTVLLPTHATIFEAT